MELRRLIVLFMNSIDRTIQVLNCLSKTDGNLGLAVISPRITIPKNTVNRILKILMKYPLFGKYPVTSEYRLAIQLLRYSHSFYSSFDLREYPKDILKKISVDTGLAAFLSIWQDGNELCIDSVTSSHKPGSRDLFVEAGKIMPYHCTASSKILLACQSPEETPIVVKQTKLKRYTSRTIVDSQNPIEHFRKIRTKGYTICFLVQLTGAAGNEISQPIG